MDLKLLVDKYKRGEDLTLAEFKELLNGLLDYYATHR